MGSQMDEDTEFVKSLEQRRFPKLEAWIKSPRNHFRKEQ